MIIKRHRHTKRYSLKTIAEGNGLSGASQRQVDGKYVYTANIGFRSEENPDERFSVELTEAELEDLYSRFTKSKAAWIAGDERIKKLNQEMKAEEKAYYENLKYLPIGE